MREEPVEEPAFANMKNINTNPHLRETFLRIKPLCDTIMKDPSPDHLALFGALLEEMKQDSLQDMQQYLLYPFTSHLQAEDNAYVSLIDFNLI